MRACGYAGGGKLLGKDLYRQVQEDKRAVHEKGHVQKEKEKPRSCVAHPGLHPPGEHKLNVAHRPESPKGHTGTVPVNPVQLRHVKGQRREHESQGRNDTGTVEK